MVATPIATDDKVIQVTLRFGSMLPAYIGANASAVKRATVMMLNINNLSASFRDIGKPNYYWTNFIIINRY